MADELFRRHDPFDKRRRHIPARAKQVPERSFELG